jgi:hypothetical protein
MTIAAHVVMAVATLLIDYGWRALDGGGHEYIIQVPPELIDTLRAEGLESYVPPDVRDVRRIRIQVGSGALAEQEGSGESPASGISEIKAAKPASRDSAAAAEDLASADDASGTRTAKYPSQSPADAAADSPQTAANEPSDEGAQAQVLDLDLLTLFQIGLGLAAAVIVFLGWLHLSMRARYRALLHRVHDPAV